MVLERMEEERKTAEGEERKGLRGEKGRKGGEGKRPEG